MRPPKILMGGGQNPKFRGVLEGIQELGGMEGGGGTPKFGVLGGFGGSWRGLGIS